MLGISLLDGWRRDGGVRDGSRRAGGMLPKGDVGREVPAGAGLTPGRSVQFGRHARRLRLMFGRRDRKLRVHRESTPRVSGGRRQPASRTLWGIRG